MDSRDRGIDVAQMWVTLDRLINAVKSAVPEEMWGNIVEKLKQSERDSKALNVRAGALYDGTDPGELANFDDELDTASRVEEKPSGATMKRFWPGWKAAASPLAQSSLHPRDTAIQP